MRSPRLLLLLATALWTVSSIYAWAADAPVLTIAYTGNSYGEIRPCPT